MFSSLGAKWEKNDHGILQQIFFFLWFALFINEDILPTFVWVFILIIFELSMPKGEHF